MLNLPVRQILRYSTELNIYFYSRVLVHGYALAAVSTHSSINGYKQENWKTYQHFVGQTILDTYFVELKAFDQEFLRLS